MTAQELIDIFEDTQRILSENPPLVQKTLLTQAASQYNQPIMQPPNTAIANPYDTAVHSAYKNFFILAPQMFEHLFTYCFTVYRFV